MKKTIVVVAILALLAFWGIRTYNRMVNTREEVNKEWAQVESAYQRRADLIPNLVATVKGYAEHEKETLEAVINARSKATQVTVDPQNLSAEELREFQAAQNEVSSTIGRLLMVVEQYPDLKANQNFLELQSQLEGTENRINVARNKFNEAAKTYNTMILRFPQNLMASIFGFKQKGYFAAAEGSDKAPKVEF